MCMAIDATILASQIGVLLDAFYIKRIVALDDLKLQKTLLRKNPYLFRAAGVSDANQIVEDILRAFVSSSDETLFGNEFFEPLVKWVAQRAFTAPEFTVTTSDGEGVDIMIQSNSFLRPIAVKSGVNVFNAASKKKQGENFVTLQKRLQKLALHFDPVVGYCYGRKKQAAKSKINFKELAGQAFWHSVTNEEDFYLRIVQLMGTKPAEHRASFQDSFDRAKNRFAQEFLADFSKSDGAIDWDKLLQFNSGVAGVPKTATKKATKKRTKKPTQKSS